MVLDCLQVAVYVFEGVVGGFLGGFRSFHVLVLTLIIIGCE